MGDQDIESGPGSDPPIEYDIARAERKVEYELTDEQREFLARSLEPLAQGLAAQSQQLGRMFESFFRPLQEQAAAMSRIVISDQLARSYAEVFRATSAALRPQLEQLVAGLAVGLDGAVRANAGLASVQATAHGASVSSGRAVAITLPAETIGITDEVQWRLEAPGPRVLPEPTAFLATVAVLMGLAALELGDASVPVILATISAMLLAVASLPPRG